MPNDFLPVDIDAEAAVLGSIILDNTYLNDIIHLLEKDSFSLPSHQIIFQTMTTMFDNHIPIDVVTLRNSLSQSGNLDKVGGESYLLTLVEKVPYPSSNALHYAKILKEKQLLRSLVISCSNVIQEVQNGIGDSSELLDKLEQTLFTLANTKSTSDVVKIDKVVDLVYSSLEKRREGGGAEDIIQTGYKDLDDLLVGLHPGEFIIIAGRPSMGKTSLALSLIENIAIVQEKPALLFTLESDQSQIVMNMLSSLARIDSNKLRKNLLNEEERGRLLIASSTLSSAPIYIDNSKSLTPLELKAKARRLKVLHDIQIVFVDYIQLLDVRQVRTIENRQQEIAFISRSLKSMARELNIPVVALAQLSRSVDSREGHRPVLSDLRESGALEQDADVVLLLYREEYYDPDTDKLGICEVKVAKQRHGPTGTVYLTFLKNFMRFESSTTEIVESY